MRFTRTAITATRKKPVRLALLAIGLALVGLTSAQAQSVDHPSAISTAGVIPAHAPGAFDGLHQAQGVTAQAATPPAVVALPSTDPLSCMQVPADTVLPTSCMVDDWLSHIGSHFGISYTRLFDANPDIANPNVVTAGQLIRIPAPDEQIAPRDLPAPPPRVATPRLASAAPSEAAVPATPVPTVIPDDGSVTSIIYAAAAEFGANGDQLVRVASCESGLDPTNWFERAKGRTLENVLANNLPVGLFQFKPTTFYGNGGTDIWSATDQARTAARMFANGQAGQWSCK